MKANSHLFHDLTQPKHVLRHPGGLPDFCYVLNHVSKTGHQVVLQTCEVKARGNSSEVDKGYCRMLSSVSLSYMLRVLEKERLKNAERGAQQEGEYEAACLEEEKGLLESQNLGGVPMLIEDPPALIDPSGASSSKPRDVKKRSAPPLEEDVDITAKGRELHVPYIIINGTAIEVLTIWYDYSKKRFRETLLHTFDLARYSSNDDDEGVKKFTYYLFKSVSILQAAAGYFATRKHVSREILKKGKHYAHTSKSKGKYKKQKTGGDTPSNNPDDASNSGRQSPGDVASLRVISNSSSFNLFEVQPHFAGSMQKDGSATDDLRYLSGWMRVSDSPSLVQVFIRVAKNHRVEYEVEALKRVVEMDPTLVVCGAVPKCLNHFRVPDTEYSCVVTPMVNGLTLGCLRTSIDEALRIRTALVDIIRRLHTVGVVHRDIKPSNVLVRNASDNLSHVCLIDYDCADVCPDGNFLGKGSVGTRGYMPTPVANFRDGDAAYDMREMDWEALKITLRELCSRSGLSREETESVVSGVPNPYSMSGEAMEQDVFSDSEEDDVSGVNESLSPSLHFSSHSDDGSPTRGGGKYRVGSPETVTPHSPSEAGRTVSPSRMIVG